MDSRFNKESSAIDSHKESSAIDSHQLRVHAIILYEEWSGKKNSL
jgi:hypothetical protein